MLDNVLLDPEGVAVVRKATATKAVDCGVLGLFEAVQAQSNSQCRLSHTFKTPQAASFGDWRSERCGKRPPAGCG